MGWWDIQRDEWHLLHTHADEYLANREKNVDWFPPYLLFESSNGHIWFQNNEQRYSGTAWLNPTTGDSCWFTTYSATIVEDHSQKLWLLAYDQLFFVELSAFSHD